jgi:hypothetical protein
VLAVSLERRPQDRAAWRLAQEIRVCEVDLLVKSALGTGPDQRSDVSALEAAAASLVESDDVILSFRMKACAQQRLAGGSHSGQGGQAAGRPERARRSCGSWGRAAGCG